MGDLHVLPPNSSHELDVVVAGNTKSISSLHHLNDQPNRVRNFRAAIYQVAEENGFPSFGWLIKTPRCRLVTHVNKKLNQLVETTVHVANNVKRPVLFLQIVPKRLPRNRRASNLFWRRHRKHVPKPFPLQSS